MKLLFSWFLFSFPFSPAVLEIELKASHMLGKAVYHGVIFPTLHLKSGSGYVALAGLECSI